MFSVHCPRHGTEVLLPVSHIERLTDHDHGITVEWVCWCGERGSFLSGRSRRTSRPA